MESQRTLTLWPYLGLLTCLLLSLLLPQFWDSDSLLDGNWQTQTQTFKLGDWESTFSRHSSSKLDDFVADRFQTVDTLDPQAYFYHFPTEANIKDYSATATTAYVIDDWEMCATNDLITDTEDADGTEPNKESQMSSNTAEGPELNSPEQTDVVNHDATWVASTPIEIVVTGPKVEDLMKTVTSEPAGTVRLNQAFVTDTGSDDLANSQDLDFPDLDFIDQLARNNTKSSSTNNDVKSTIVDAKQPDDQDLVADDSDGERVEILNDHLQNAANPGMDLTMSGAPVVISEPKVVVAGPDMNRAETEKTTVDSDGFGYPSRLAESMAVGTEKDNELDSQQELNTEAPQAPTTDPHGDDRVQVAAKRIQQTPISPNEEETPQFPIISLPSTEYSARDEAPLTPTSVPSLEGIEDSDPQEIQKPLVELSQNTVWPKSTRLTRSLHRLSYYSDSWKWSEEVLSELEQLTLVTSLDDVRLADRFQRLEEYIQKGSYQVRTLLDGDHRETLARCIYGVRKRVDLWKAVFQASRSWHQSEPSFARGSLPTHLKAVQAMLGETDEGRDWATYLLLKEMKRDGEVTNPRTARRVLDRMSGPKLTLAQRELVHRPQLQALADELYRQCGQAELFPQLLNSIERYESKGRAKDGEWIAGHTDFLLRSKDTTLFRLGSQLDRHWRNANVRVSISSKLMSRYLPDASTVRSRVQNRLGAAAIRGTSWTTTEFKWHLVPNHQRIHLDLFAEGNVRSQTVANQGAARTQNQGQALFTASKSVWFDRKGIHTQAAQATSNSTVKIESVKTAYDGIPLLGSIARSMAQTRAEERKHQARQMMQQRVARSAQHRLDSIVDQQLSRFETQFETQVIQPLSDLELEPTPLTLLTTSHRVIARYRLANQSQLSAWSPRPVAFSDTLLSVQIHQSAINNVVDQLNLHGKRFDLEDLYQTIPQKLGFAPLSIPEDLPENVKVRFAAYEPIRFRFDNGRASITIRLASLSKGKRHRWRKLTVTGEYAPDVSSVNAPLIRDESIRLTGHKLSFSDQVALRSIFSNVFSRKRPLTILRTKLANDQRVQDLGIQEFAVEDGWIGIAWGVERLAANGRSSTTR
ncbi:MAG: hypothetical protein MK179_00275 [Pirellulaceae bacterium]|nr:hypothetical protein [Pirellulaceae bacterium]